MRYDTQHRRQCGVRVWKQQLIAKTSNNIEENGSKIIEQISELQRPKWQDNLWLMRDSKSNWGPIKVMGDVLWISRVTSLAYYEAETMKIEQICDWCDSVIYPCTVKRLTDNQGPGSYIHVHIHIVWSGSRKEHLQDRAIAIFELCFTHSIKLDTNTDCMVLRNSTMCMLDQQI